MLCHMTLERTDVSEELSTSVIMMTSIDELGTLAMTSNRCTVEGLGWFVCKHTKNAEPCYQVSSGHVPKVLRSQYEAFMIYWDKSHPLCWYCKEWVKSQWPPWQCSPYIWFSWRGWKNCGIECHVCGRYCVQLWPTSLDVLVRCAIAAPLTWWPWSCPPAQCRPCRTHRGSVQCNYNSLYDLLEIIM
jgi:hypothetical protein